MKNNKWNNLLVGSKKAALVALMALTLSPNVNARDGKRAYKSPMKQELGYVKHDILHDGLKTLDTAGIVEVALIIFGGLTFCFLIGYNLGMSTLRYQNKFRKDFEQKEK